MPRKNKLLIVDDDADFSTILKEGFKDKGFKIFFAKNGEEGLNLAVKEKPDLILLDVMMPKMDGMEMAQKFRKVNKKIPIIFLTNVEDMASISEAFKMPKSDYIVKSTVHIYNIVSIVKDKLKIK